MEKKNRRAVIVGIFVFLALVIFIVGVMTLGGQKSLFNKGATIQAVFTEVNGLQPGNNVWFSGVKVGTVKSIALDKNGHVLVQMNIEEKSQAIIKKDTKAKVGADGFIGNKIVVLYGGSDAAGVVENGNTLAVEKTISTDEMMATLQENNRNILAITSNFKTISERIIAGQGSVGKLLQDEALFTDLQQSILSIKVAAANAQQLTANVASYSQKLTAKGSLVNDLVTDTVIFSRLRSTVREIDALSARATEVVENLNAASRNVSAKLQDPSSPAGLLLNDKETAASIRQTIRNLQASTQKLDENMEALQSNFLLRGFFKKRNKSGE